MAHNIPYVNQPGSIVKVLEKIKEAKVPDRFTIDFLETKLGCRGGNYRQFISLGKKLNLLNPDGTPTEIYKKFRNPDTSEIAMATAIKIGYSEVFDRNEFANNMPAEKFKGLILEITGLETKNKVVQLICSTFLSLKKLSNFEGELNINEGDESEVEEEPLTNGSKKLNGGDNGLDLNLSYSINLVLPKTDDPAVFNAIFKSLKENLLKK